MRVLEANICWLCFLQEVEHEENFVFKCLICYEIEGKFIDLIEMQMDKIDENFRG